MKEDMTYQSAALQEVRKIYEIVQYTIKAVYPKYYPAEVVDFFCDLHSMNAITQDVEAGNCGILIADGKIVGTGSFAENHITRVYVLPEYQKKGYGTFIVENIEEEIGKKHTEIYLDASLPAAALYEKLGYKTIKHEKHPVENGVILAYEIMKKKISAADLPYTYKKAAIDDIDELVRTRIEVLRAANKLPEHTDMSRVERESYEYYKRALKSGEHIGYLVYDKDTFAGAGGVSFYQVMPTYHNPSGQKAYIMNMYTAPEYRRRGIGYKTLDLLVKEIRRRNISQIALEATDMGRPLYEKYGFVTMKNEMELITDQRQFDYKRIAEGYVKDRPYLHGYVMEMVKQKMKLRSNFKNGMDIGCGAGLSTKALRTICDNVTGTDISSEMIEAAHALHGEKGYSFRVCRAEDMEADDKSLDIVTAAGTINWIDENKFLPRLQNALADEGLLLIYDFWITDKMEGHQEYTDWWHQEYLPRFPKPGRKEHKWTDDDIAAYGFQIFSQEEYAITYEMDMDYFIRFMLLQSNVIAQVEEGGRDLEEVKMWFYDTLSKFWKEEKQKLIFEGYNWYIVKISR